ncbi:MAG: hypothetical protein WC549_00375 [Actinomycetota bacterium]
MRISLTIPNEFASEIKERLPVEGYTTFSSYILDLIRKDISKEKELKKQESLKSINKI